LGRALELPQSVSPAATTASGAYFTDGSNPLTGQQQIERRETQPPIKPPAGNSIEIHVTPKPDGAAPADPANAKPTAQNKQPIMPVNSPDAPLELTTVVVSDGSSHSAANPSPPR
jgi:hypothetical protein